VRPLVISFEPISIPLEHLTLRFECLDDSDVVVRHDQPSPPENGGL